MPRRDDFSPKVKHAVGARAGWHCSFEGCAKPMVGPSEEAPDAINNIGEAPHICTASPGGRRYNPNMTSEERAGIGNAMWLCFRSRQAHRPGRRHLPGQPAARDEARP